MSNFAASFASLVKFNNGFFKSEAQAKFLLSVCQEENTFITSGTVYRNSFTLFYTCDIQGVVKVEKYLPTTGKTVVTFERLTTEQFEAKQLAQAEANARETALNERYASEFQARQDAFNNALTVAKAFVKQMMLETGSSENIAQSAVDMLLKDQDGITMFMSDLVKSPEFVKAWEAYNTMR